MDWEGRLSFIKAQLEFCPLYVYEIDPNEKWGAFKDQDYSNCLVEPFYYKDAKNKEEKYFNRKVKKLYKRARILLSDDDFINAVLRIAERFSLKKRMYGWAPEVRKRVQELSQENGNSTTSTGKVRTPSYAYDPELVRRLRTIWYCYLEACDIQYWEYVTKKYGNKKNIKKIEAKLPEVLSSVIYQSELRKVLKKFELSLLWLEPVELLLLTGWFFVPYNFCPIIENSLDNLNPISIPVLRETSLEDIVFNWEKIKEAQSRVYSSLTPISKEYLSWGAGINDFEKFGISEDKEKQGKEAARKRKYRSKKKMQENDELLTEEMKQFLNHRKAIGLENGVRLI